MINLPKPIEYILNHLNSNGYDAFIVGGSVRNALLGLPINDFDVTTNANPQTIQNLFNSFKTLDIGIKHGTITVIIDNYNVEITTYRIESNYLDSRHPSKVTFTTSLKMDCSRRDFTINALCYNPNTGIIDFYNGQDDLKKQLIKCINDPNIRFKEDALRILRAIRFKAQLNFKIEKDTQTAIFKNKLLLNNISIERKIDEFNKIILSNKPSIIINEYLDIFNTFIPCLKSQDQTLDKLDNLELKLAYLFKDTLLIELTTILKTLKYSNKTIKTINDIIINKDISFDKNSCINLLSKYRSTLDLILKYHQIVNNIDIENTINIINKYPIYDIKQLCVNGNDLKNFINDKQIKNELENILNLVIDGQIENSKEKIIIYLKNKYKKS